MPTGTKKEQQQQSRATMASVVLQAGLMGLLAEELQARTELEAEEASQRISLLTWEMGFISLLAGELQKRTALAGKEKNQRTALLSEAHNQSLGQWLRESRSKQQVLLNQFNQFNQFTQCVVQLPSDSTHPVATPTQSKGPDDANANSSPLPQAVDLDELLLSLVSQDTPNLGMASFLLAQGASTTKCCNQGKYVGLYPLCIAIERKQYGLMAVLLAPSGLHRDIQAQCENNPTAWIRAFKKQDCIAVGVLAEGGVLLDGQTLQALTKIKDDSLIELWPCIQALLKNIKGLSELQPAAEEASHDLQKEQERATGHLSNLLKFYRHLLKGPVRPSASINPSIGVYQRISDLLQHADKLTIEAQDIFYKEVIFSYLKPELECSDADPDLSNIILDKIPLGHLNQHLSDFLSKLQRAPGACMTQLAQKYKISVNKCADWPRCRYLLFEAWVKLEKGFTLNQALYQCVWGGVLDEAKQAVEQGAKQAVYRKVCFLLEQTTMERCGCTTEVGVWQSFLSQLDYWSTCMLWDIVDLILRKTFAIREQFTLSLPVNAVTAVLLGTAALTSAERGSFRASPKKAPNAEQPIRHNFTQMLRWVFQFKWTVDDTSRGQALSAFKAAITDTKRCDQAREATDGHIINQYNIFVQWMQLANQLAAEEKRTDVKYCPMPKIRDDLSLLPLREIRPIEGDLNRTRPAVLRSLRQFCYSVWKKSGNHITLDHKIKQIQSAYNAFSQLEEIIIKVCGIHEEYRASNPDPCKEGDCSTAPRIDSIKAEIDQATRDAFSMCSQTKWKENNGYENWIAEKVLSELIQKLIKLQKVAEQHHKDHGKMKTTGGLFTPHGFGSKMAEVIFTELEGIRKTQLYQLTLGYREQNLLDLLL